MWPNESMLPGIKLWAWTNQCPLTCYVALSSGLNCLYLQRESGEWIHHSLVLKERNKPTDKLISRFYNTKRCNKHWFKQRRFRKSFFIDFTGCDWWFTVIISSQPPPCSQNNTTGAQSEAGEFAAVSPAADPCRLFSWQQRKLLSWFLNALNTDGEEFNSYNLTDPQWRRSCWTRCHKVTWAAERRIPL